MIQNILCLLFFLFALENSCLGIAKNHQEQPKKTTEKKHILKKKPLPKNKNPHKKLKKDTPNHKKPKQKRLKTKALFLANNSKHNAKQPKEQSIALDETEESPTNDELATAENTNQTHYIRVLLDEYPSQESRTITLKAQDGFVLESPAHSNVTALFQAEQLVILIKDGSFFLKCQDEKYRRIKHNDIEICSPHNKVTLNNIVYQGSLHLCQDRRTSSILVVNKLDLEDYLYSVVRHEGIPSWPLEMHKVQAIASRTFALFHMKQSRLKNPRAYYDIKNTSHCQVYNGSHKEKHLRQAVEETRNMILTHKGNIALTMFDICCGGIIPGNLRQRDVTKPYLYRKEPCHFCKNTPANYSWRESCSKKTVLERLKDNAKCKDKLKFFGSTLVDIQVIDKDKAGIVRKVKCIGKRHNTILAGHEIKSALRSQLKSTAFSIKNDGHRLVFNGHGNSHFKGLCQWGAKGLVDRGWHFKEILQFYYPQTKLSYLK